MDEEDDEPVVDGIPRSYLSNAPSARLLLKEESVKNLSVSERILSVSKDVLVPRADGYPLPAKPLVADAEL